MRIGKEYKMARKKSFFNWMKTQTKRDDPVGDLAADSVRDWREDQPKASSVYMDWRNYISYHASYNSHVLNALNMAYKEYCEAIGIECPNFRDIEREEYYANARANGWEPEYDPFEEVVFTEEEEAEIARYQKQLNF